MLGFGISFILSVFIVAWPPDCREEGCFLFLPLVWPLFALNIAADALGLDVVFAAMNYYPWASRLALLAIGVFVHTATGFGLGVLYSLVRRKYAQFRLHRE